LIDKITNPFIAKYAENIWQKSIGVDLKTILKLGITMMVLITLKPSTVQANKFIAADNPNIQYFGRWDFTDKLRPKHSWPGVFIFTEFTGTSIGIRLDDNISYYNVYIDGEFYKVFHGDVNGEHDYTLAQNLEDKKHTLRFSKRNISFDPGFTFYGLILDDNAELHVPQAKPQRKIEFIGDSFTAAESNEAVEQELEWEKRFPVTNIDKGFAALIAKHYKADYITTCRSGSGIVCDWQGNSDNSLPKLFDRTLMENAEPKWDFNKWIPDLVVICLGLNDFSGMNKDGVVSEEKSDLFRNSYRDFLKEIWKVYPGVCIVAIAAYPEWIRFNVKKIVEEEIADGNEDIHYTQFDFYEGGYVANGHPTVDTHKKIAEQIITAIDSFKLFSE